MKGPRFTRLNPGSGWLAPSCSHICPSLPSPGLSLPGASVVALQHCSPASPQQEFWSSPVLTQLPEEPVPGTLSVLSLGCSTVRKSHGKLFLALLLLLPSPPCPSIPPPPPLSQVHMDLLQAPTIEYLSPDPLE